MKKILDATCGSKMMWFNKNNPHVEFCDNREVPYHEYYPHRYIEIKPDTVCDFTDLPFPDKQFKLAVFDPPHLMWAGKRSWINLKYGCLDKNWKQMIHDGFWECMRVLDDYGTLIFKWSEVQIPLRDVLDAIKAEPLFGHRSGKQMNTHWMTFMKLLPKEEEMNNTKLKPCPFCGGKTKAAHSLYTKNRSWVFCTMCGIQTQVYAASEKAAKAWNRRVKEDK